MYSNIHICIKFDLANSKTEDWKMHKSTTYSTNDKQGKIHVHWAELSQFSWFLRVPQKFFHEYLAIVK